MTEAEVIIFKNGIFGSNFKTDTDSGSWTFHSEFIFICIKVYEQHEGFK